MAEPVVHLFEVIEVDEHRGRRLRTVVSGATGLFGHAQQAGPVGQAGERVVVRFPFGPFGLSLGAFAKAHQFDEQP